MGLAPRRRRRDASCWHMLWLCVAIAAAGLFAPVHSDQICETVTKCRKNGGDECDRRNASSPCPPCIYSLAGGQYTCWDKDPVTNTCPYTGVKYDCSTVWASASSSNSTLPSSSSSNSTTTAATTPPTTSGDSSQTIMFAAIGGGAVLVIIIAVFVIRRRRRGRNMPYAMGSPQVFNSKHGHIKTGSAGAAATGAAPTPYGNAPDSSKEPYNMYSSRKASDPSMLETGGTSDTAYSHATTDDSLDGMLSDHEMPAMLGDPKPKNRHKARLSRGFKRINSGGRRGDAAKVNEDVSARCTNSANVFDEYLKMKQEMKFDTDAMSDYASERSSLDRFSLASEITIGGGIPERTLSIADSEYAGDVPRNRAESECYSEMSYNDEKYSFSESMDEGDAVDLPVDREVEI
ncbi:hypothetical protein PINS_up006791 [Pythium insidiosum]|nr:hypothetical protein PINS_up006791 [Pythium insidiosum]